MRPVMPRRWPRCGPSPSPRTTSSSSTPGPPTCGSATCQVRPANNHVLGYTLQQLGMALDDDDPEAKAREYLAGIDTGEFQHMVAHVRQHLDGDTASSFELVLDLILDGLVRLDEAR